MDPVQALFEDLRSPDSSIRFSVLSRIEGIDWTPDQLLAFRDFEKSENDPGSKFHMRMILARLEKQAVDHSELSHLAQVESILRKPERDYLSLAILLETIPRSEAPLVAMAFRENRWTEFSSEVLPFILQFFKRYGSYEDSQEIVPFCRHPDPRVLAAAVEALEKLSPESLQGLIVPLLVSPIHGIRSRAVRLLYKWDPLEAIRHFEALLFSEDPADRQAALFHAFFFPFPDIEPLMLRFLSVEDSSTTIAKAGLLFRANPNTEVLLKILEILEGSATEKRKTIREILMGIINSLIQAGLVDKNPEQLISDLKETFRKKRVSQISEQCRIALRSDESENRLAAIKRLCEFSGLGFSDSEKILKDHLEVEKLPELKSIIVNHLGVPSSEAEPREDVIEISDSFESLLPKQRIKVLATLDSKQLAKIRKQIPKILNSCSDEEKVPFAQAIGRVGNKEDSPLLSPFLKSPEPSLLVAAIEALSNLNPDVLFPYLPKLVQHSSDEVRATALRVFSIFDKKQALALVEQMMFNLKPKQRSLAILSASQFDFPSVRGLLLKAMEREKETDNLRRIQAILKENLDEELFFEVNRILEITDESSREVIRPMIEEFSQILIRDGKSNCTSAKELIETTVKKLESERKKKEAQPSYSLQNVKKIRQQQGKSGASQPDKIGLDPGFAKFTVLAFGIGVILTAVIWFGFLAPGSGTPPKIKPGSSGSKGGTQAEQIELKGKVVFSDPGGQGILVQSEKSSKEKYYIHLKQSSSFKKDDKFNGKVKIYRRDAQTVFCELIVIY
ncbi:HEAT repeat domain-containing protein [bacterium]|nr:HEAT repeat domain-containing protein [bacterium]